MWCALQEARWSSFCSATIYSSGSQNGAPAQKWSRFPSFTVVVLAIETNRSKASNGIIVSRASVSLSVLFLSVFLRIC